LCKGTQRLATSDGIKYKFIGIYLDKYAKTWRLRTSANRLSVDELSTINAVVRVAENYGYNALVHEQTSILWI
jgi:hypothetical protein